MIKGTLSPAKQWLIERGYMKHPKDKAERMYINDKKRKKNNRSSVKTVHDGPDDTFRSDDTAE